MTKQITDKSIGQVIKERRVEMKMTQRQLSKKANVGHTYLSEIENEKKTPGLEFLFKVSKAMEINLEDLLKRSNYNETGQNISKGDVNND